MGLRGRSIEGRVVVVTKDDEATLGDCLDGVAAACPPGIEVFVVDVDSSDGSADAAIRHPRVDRVIVVPGGDLNTVVNTAAGDTPRMALLRGSSRPTLCWVKSAFDALEHADLAIGAGDDPLNLAVDLRTLPPISLFSASPAVEDLVVRATAAGAEVKRSRRMVLEPAARRPVEQTDLPVQAAPRASVERATDLISVVVCTRDRSDHLPRCLDSLRRLEDDDHEIIVIDNHDVPTVPRELVPRDGRLVNEPRQGLDIARNRGIAEADGTIVAFIDDDCEADPHWLAGIRAAFSDPEVGLVTGRVRPASLDQPSERYFEAYFTFDRGTVRRRFTPWDRRPSYPAWTGGIGTGCNMAMRRSLLREVGGFDELLDMGSLIGGGGDLDIFARVLDHQAIIEYAPDALVWHHHRDRMASLTKQFIGYGQSVGAVVLKTVLTRRGLRARAILFYAQWLTGRARFARQILRGEQIVPMRLLLADLYGGLIGPFRYAAARAGTRR
jgi:GT2 family glycosyltransferase